MPRVAALAALVGGIALVACGGDEGGGSEDFVAEADAICIDAAEANREALASSLEGSAEDANRAYLTDVVAIRGGEIEQLRELTPSEDHRDAYREYLKLRTEAIDILGVALEESPGEPTDLSRAGARAEAARDRSDQVAAGIGLEACANRLPPADEAAIEETITTSVEPERAEEVCRELSTERFQALFGGVEACVEAQRSGPGAGEVQFRSLKGVEGVLAEAEVRITGGGRGQITEFVVNLLFEEGTWKLERIESTG